MNNKKPNKDFDCVENKRKGSKLIYEQIKEMTREEELKYWKEKARVLKELQVKSIKKQKKSA